MRVFLVLFFLFLAGFSFWLLPDEHGFYPVAVRRLVSQVFPAGLTPAAAAEKYATGRLRILLVPGHDNDYVGAEFGGLKESDLTRALGERLAAYLTEDKNLTVFTTRDFATGDYQPEFLDYFRRERAAINSFRSELRTRFLSFVRSGAVTEETAVTHNFAAEEVRVRLYGINKWANEQGIDLVLHLHFNDYPRRLKNRAGVFRGFAVYVPERQLPAHQLSRALGEAVKERLRLESSVSNLPQEAAGVIPDQELIAVGAAGSRDSASLLIEYGYIYESQFTNPARQMAALETLARRTAEGVRTYFSVPGGLAL